MEFDQVNRRTVLKGIGAVGGAGLSSTTAIAASSQQSVPGNAPYTEVYPFGCRDLDSDACSLQEVPVGDWILHTVWWVEPGAEACGGADLAREQLHEFLEKEQTTAIIGGEWIPNAGQYYTDPYYSDAFDTWTVQWKYATPPKKEGTTNRFRFRIGFDPPHTEYDPDHDGENVCETELSTFGGLVQGAYTVTAPAQKGNVDKKTL